MPSQLRGSRHVKRDNLGRLFRDNAGDADWQRGFGADRPTLRGKENRGMGDARELFLTKIKLWLDECLRVSKSGVIWFCASSMLPHILPGYEEYFQRLLIWDKPPGSQFAGAMHNKLWYSMEPILVFDKNNLTKKGKNSPYSYSTFQARTIAKKKYGHPTTKPLPIN